MIRNTDSKRKYLVSFAVALVVHAVIFAFVKKDLTDFAFLDHLSDVTKNMKEPLKIDQIDIIKPSEVEKFRTVGIKNGKKDLQRPDIQFKKPEPPAQKGAPGAADKLSFENLAPKLPKPSAPKPTTESKPVEKPAAAKPATNSIAREYTRANPSEGGHFYFNYKDNKVITQSAEQEILKTEASKNFSAPMNKATEKISNFEIRYERPEGVSEDELNSDEKAYYSFYVRSYKNYFQKIYANYEKIVVERPGLSKVFDRKHLLIGKIDYDEQGNIVTVKIIKSSDSDDLHYFFEETLKQLNQPNPPKIFTKNRKQFSIYYQIQIN